jgi:hypothetical protein
MTKAHFLPHKKNISLIYSTLGATKTRLFKSLIIQISPKNSIFQKLAFSRLGILFNYLTNYTIDIPNITNQFLGIYKMNKIILFELIDSDPKYVWKKTTSGKWEKEEFLGFPLIEEYSTKEYFKKRFLIEKAFKTQWDKLLNNRTNIHGDFTHFNILTDDKNNVYFIDQKVIKNSLLYDYFYFYAYLKQALLRKNDIKNNDRKIILKDLEMIIKKNCFSSNEMLIKEELNKIHIPNKCGILDKNKVRFLNDFKKLFDEKK